MDTKAKVCANCENQFQIYPDDLAFYQKIGVPPPTFCPECRYIRRLLDRNEYNFYKRKCSATGENIISIYRPEQPFPVYKQDYWKSDAWDALSYGRDFDFNRPFFDQYEDLRRVTPHLALVNANSVNSEYTNQSESNKDCYMLVTSNTSEKCMYGSWNQNQCYMCFDCYMVENCQFCYEGMNLTKCSSCAWVRDSSDCMGVYFSVDCRGCSNCFGCVGLRNKQYHWFNENVGKEEYESRVKKIIWDRNFIQTAQNKLVELCVKIPVKYYHGSQTQNSSGDYLENTERARMCFNCRDNKDTAYMQDAWDSNSDCLDNTEIIKGELSYEIQGVDTPRRAIVARSCFSIIADSCYCDMCFGVNNCFGCFGLKQKQYCVLNKQYSKEEYLELKKKIIAHMVESGEWGEYFPARVSPFAYNESMAQDYFPLAKEEALARGYVWYNRPDRNYDFTLSFDKLPSAISEASDDILRETIQCRTQASASGKNPLCTEAFRLVPQELTLYRKLGIPVPEYCFPCRRSKRFAFRNPRRLYHRSCMKPGCQNEFETSYPPDSQYIVYCEQCYNAEVV